MSRHKYNVASAEQRRYGNRTYDSKAEMRYAVELDLRVAAGELLWWIPQPLIMLGEDFSTRIDFLVCSRHGELYGVEVKGAETQQWRTVRRMLIKYAPFPIHVVKRGGTAEVIERGEHYARSCEDRHRNA